jgi:hypothetical protein
VTVATDGSVSTEVEHAQASNTNVSVSGGLLCSYRASLASCGLWESVRLSVAARSDVAPAWLDEVQPSDWLDLSHLTSLLDGLAQRLEPELLKTLVRRRMVEPSGSNFYAPVLRSWTRSFSDSPSDMLRGLSPLWRAALRHAEPPEVLSVAAGEVHVLLTGTVARALRSCEALSASFEGVLLGLLDLCSPRPVLGDVELLRAPLGIRAVCRF